VGKGLVQEWMSRDLLDVKPEDTARAAVEVLLQGGVRHLLVREAGDLVGIVSNRDVIRVTLSNAGRVLDMEGCAVREIMTPSPLVTTTPGASLAQAAGLMRKEGVGALPVMDGDELVGIITSDDVLGAVAVDG
jgi:acetoin utilization protein AcuB